MVSCSAKQASNTVDKTCLWHDAAEAQRLQLGEEEVVVRVRLPARARRGIGDLLQLRVATPSALGQLGGKAVPRLVAALHGELELAEGHPLGVEPLIAGRLGAGELAARVFDWKSG